MMGKNYEVSNTLIANGADIANRDIEGKTPCHTFFNRVVGEMLLAHKENLADILSCDNNGMGVLHYVAWSSKSEPKHMFACAGSNDVYSLFARDSLGRNALHFASQRGNLALIRNLLDLPYNISIDSPDLAGQTALHHAVQNRRVDAISTLIKAGANIYAVDSKGRTPIDCAIERKNELAVSRLVQVAQNLNAGKLKDDDNEAIKVSKHSNRSRDDLSILPSARTCTSVTRLECSVHNAIEKKERLWVWLVFSHKYMKSFILYLNFCFAGILLLAFYRLIHYIT